MSDDNATNPMLVFDNEGEYTEESMGRLLAGSEFGADRERPYDGQPWTAHGARGQTVISALTMRDIGDCIARGAVLVDGSVRPAVIQSALIEIEKLMGIYPNVPRGPLRIPMLTIGPAPEPPKDAS
jgi:hypothetical protein